MNIINPYRFAGDGDVTFGNASRSFDGTNDYLTVADGSWIPTGAQTWSCWVKLDTTGTYSFFNHNGGSPNKSIQILVVSGGKFRMQVSSSGSNSENLDSTTTPTTGTWYHVAGVFNPSLQSRARRIYVNGVEEANTTTSFSSLNDTSVDIGIGANSGGNFKLDGKLADCRIYDADIGDSAIADLASGTDYQTNLVGWWLTDSDDIDDYASTNDATEGSGSSSTYDTDGPLD
jgi:hypothetical protein